MEKSGKKLIADDNEDVLFASLAAMVAFTIAFKVRRTVRLSPAEVIKCW